MRRAPVLIIGGHRSGTSATAQALGLLGLKIGVRLDSHAEPRGLQKVHDEYLHRLGAAWHTPQPLLSWLDTEAGREHCTAHLARSVRRDFAGTFAYDKRIAGFWHLARIQSGFPWGWKEPRTTLFAPIWLRIFPDAAILHVIRHPLDAALSIQARELKFRQAGDPPDDQLDELASCLRLALTYIRQAEAVAALTQNYRRVKFEDLQSQPKQVLRALASWCGLHPSDARLQRAAATIRPRAARRWGDLSRDTARDLLAQQPMAEELGYTADDF